MIARIRYPRRLSDEECVAQARRAVATWDRWRPWLVALYVLNVALIIGCAIGVAILFESGLAPKLPDRWFGFALGLAFGAWIGLHAVHTVHGLATVLTGLRSERLLVKYHDEARSPDESDRVP